MPASDGAHEEVCSSRREKAVLRDSLAAVQCAPHVLSSDEWILMLY